MSVNVERVLATGTGLDQDDILEVLTSPDEDLPDLLAAAHAVRLRWCGPEVEVEGIVSVKTGGCPEDCHFCSQSGVFTSPVRAVWLDIPELVEAARQTAATGATEFCLVAAVRGPDERLMAQVRAGIAAIRAAVDINIAASLGILTADQVDELAAMGCTATTTTWRRPAASSRRIVTTHTWEERWDTLRLVRDAGMEVCCGGILGMGESVAQRAEFAAQLTELDPTRSRSTSSIRAPARRWPTRACCPPSTRCGPSPRSGSRCPVRSCGTPAAARSRWAIWGRATDCSAASTRSSSATTSRRSADRRRRIWSCWPTCRCR
jgi:biotin synthase